MRNRLLTFGVLCIAGTVNTALLGGATTLAVGLASNILAADLGTLWDKVANRLRGRDAILQSEGLSQAVGRAIAAVIAKFTRENGEHIPEDRQALRKLANHAAQEWQYIINAPDFVAEPEFDPVREPYLAQMFSQKPSEFDQVRALTPESWERVLTAWQSGVPDMTLAPQTTRVVSQQLYSQFPKALRQVLKEDFAKDGRAYGAVVLDLFGVLRETLQGQHETLLARIDGLTGVDRDQAEREYEQLLVRLDELTAQNSQAFKDLAPRIESGFGDVTALLLSLRGELDERLTHLQADVTAIKENMMAAQAQPGLLLAGQPHVSLEDWQGREKELDWLYGKIAQSKVLLGIEGIGGLGKSTLASKLFAEPMPEVVVATRGELQRRFWADVSAGGVFSEWARQLLLAFKVTVPLEEQHLINTVVQCLQIEPSLVVVDNLESLLTPDLEWQEPLYREFFQTWLECGHRSTVVVTTRERPNLRGMEWLPQFRGLAPEEGAALLAAKGITGNLTAFVEVVQGHPLLLRLVADLLREEYPEASHLERLQDLGLADLRQLLTNPQVVGVHRREEVGMVLVLDASYQRLSPLQQEILQAVAVLRGTFSEQAVQFCAQGSVNTAKMNQALKGLAKRSFLQRVTQPSVDYTFQPVVQEYVRLQIENLAERHGLAIDYYHLLALPPSDWKEIEDTRYQLEIVHHQFERQNYGAVNETLRECNEFLSLRGAYSLLVEWNQRLVDIWQPKESEREGYSWALINLGNAYNSQGDYGKAINYYEKALGIQRTIGHRNGEVASLINLGNAYSSQGDYGKAINYYKKSLGIQRTIGHRNGEAASLIGLGNAYSSQGDYGKAINYYEQSLGIKCEIGDCNGEADSLIGLGNAYTFQGNYVKAINYYKQSLGIKRAIGDRNGEALSLNNLGAAYNSQGENGKAINYYEQSLVIKRAIGDRNGEALSLFGLGNAYNSQSDYGKAINYYEQSLEIQRTIGDCNGEADSLIGLGAAYNSQSDYVRAINYYKQSLAIKCSIGDRHGEAKSWFNLGIVLSHVNRVPDAMGAYRNARRLYSDVGLEARVQACDDALHHLSSSLEPPHRRNPSIWRRLWNWLKQQWHRTFSLFRSRD
jgi:tetratricopeptide (TPR) repeat protein